MKNESFRDCEYFTKFPNIEMNLLKCFIASVVPTSPSLDMLCTIQYIDYYLLSCNVFT